MNQRKMTVTTRYAQSDEFDYKTSLVRVNLDDERFQDVITGNGFIVSSPKAIKDDIKDPNGIFSTKYGPGLQDVNAFGNRYRCKCGLLEGKLYEGSICKNCGTEVVYKGDNFKLFGYICINPYYIIHPNLYMSLAFLIGEKDFNDIICYVDKKDEDGHDLDIKKPKNNPFYGIGMMEFRERFDEIIKYFAQKRPNKKEYYEDILANKDKIFIQSIPVFTLHLRPYRIDNGTLSFEGTNAIYNIMAHIADRIKRDKNKMDRKAKPKNMLLYELQMKYQELYEEITKIISGKKGSARQLFGGRYVIMAA